MSPKFYPTLFQHLATDYRRNLAVTAGAGTGKTEVLTRRIVKILAREKFCLDRLLVVTFTDKAAVEMKERIYSAIEKELQHSPNPHFQKLKDNFLNNNVSTFHGFCAALLREYPIEAGIDPYFRVMDESDKVFFLRRSILRSLKELAADRNNASIQKLSEEFSRSSLVNALYSLIQKREDMGAWVTNFGETSRESYFEHIRKCRECLLIEMTYKLYKSRQLEICLDKLNIAAPQAADDKTIATRKRDSVLMLLSLLIKEMAPAAAGGSVDIDRIISLKEEIYGNLKLTGSCPKAWNEQDFAALKEVFASLKYLLDWYDIESFDMSEGHEEEGFELLKALSDTAVYCLNSYRDDKAAENLLDFQDLQLKVLHLFQKGDHDHILEDLRQRFQFIMVDEFQDTNDIQWQIIKTVASDRTGNFINPKFFIVGDEKQAIYSFRGGDVGIFSRVRAELLNMNNSNRFDRRPFDLTYNNEKNYADEYFRRIEDDSALRLGEISFSDNFRSAMKPIRFFNFFFNDLLYKEVYEDYDARPQIMYCSGNKNEGSVELFIVDDNVSGTDESMDLDTQEVSGKADTSMEAEFNPHFKEALLIVDKLKEVFYGDDPKYERVRLNAKKGSPAVAILLNRRTMLKTYEEALRLNRIDFTVVRGRGFFQRQEVVDLGNLLLFLCNPMDDTALIGFLRSPAGHVPDDVIYSLSKTVSGASLWEKLKSFAKTSEASILKAAEFSDQDRQSLEGAVGCLAHWLAMSRRMPLVEFLRMVLDDGGYYASLSRGARGGQALSNIEKLLDHAREINMVEGGELSDFSEWLQERIKYLEEEGEADIDISLGGAVQIMTVHQSKGLEFPMVFVPDLGAGFNLGDKELLHTDMVPWKMTIEHSRIKRRETPEIGIFAPNPENGWESEPILIKRIIKKRLREKLIAEKKRLFYVAATRAMDHLVLVGHANLGSVTVQKRVAFAPIDHLTNWMDWVSKILGLQVQATGFSGNIIYGGNDGDAMEIPYRKFVFNGMQLGDETEYRTEFPDFKIQS